MSPYRFFKKKKNEKTFFNNIGKPSWIEHVCATRLTVHTIHV